MKHKRRSSKSLGISGDSLHETTIPLQARPHEAKCLSQLKLFRRHGSWAQIACREILGGLGKAEIERKKNTPR